MQKGDKYYIPLTRRKRIYTRPTTRIWYLNTYGQETLDYISWPKIKREEGQPDKIVATIYAIHKDYVELKLENMKIISVHLDYMDKLETLK